MNIRAFFNKYSSILLPIFFILIGILSVVVLASTHIIYSNADIPFHWNRLYELHYDLIERSLPLFNTHTAPPYGLATMTYYPYVTLLPFALLTFIIKSPVMLLYTMYGIIFTAMYFISYVSYKYVIGSKFKGLIFSILYSSTSIVYSNLIHSGDVGAVLAMVFLPLAFFGMISFIKDDTNHWMMLSMGLSLVIFSHVLSAVLLIGLLVIIGLLNIKQFFNWERIIKLLSAIFLSLITTAIFWIPFLYNMSQNAISQPQLYPNISIGILPEAFSTINYSYGLVEILGIFTIFYIKKMEKLDIYLWLIGILCLLTNFKFVGPILARIFPQISTFQFSFRFTFIAHIVFTYLLTKFITQRLHSNQNNYLFVAILVPILLFMSIGNQNNTTFLLHNRYTIGTNDNKKDVPQAYYLEPKYDDHSFDTIKHSTYSLDYAPKKLSQDISLYKGHSTFELNKKNQILRSKKYHPQADGINFDLENKVGRLVLPIVKYNGYQYEIKMDGKKLPESSLDNQYTKDKGLVLVKNIPMGGHTFQLEPKIPSLIKISFYVTLIGFMVHIFLLVWREFRILISQKKKS